MEKSNSLSSQIIVTTYNQNNGFGNGVKEAADGVGPYPNHENYQQPFIENQVMLVQEMAMNWFQDDRWDYFGVNHKEGIAWDKDRFSLVDYGTAIGDVSQLAQVDLGMPWVVLRDNQTGQTLRFVSAHVPGYDINSAQKGLEQLDHTNLLKFLQSDYCFKIYTQDDVTIKGIRDVLVKRAANAFQGKLNNALNIQTTLADPEAYKQAIGQLFAEGNDKAIRDLLLDTFKAETIFKGITGNEATGNSEAGPISTVHALREKEKALSARLTQLSSTTGLCIIGSDTNSIPNRNGTIHGAFETAEYTFQAPSYDTNWYTGTDGPEGRKLDYLFFRDSENCITENKEVVIEGAPKLNSPEAPSDHLPVTRSVTYQYTPTPKGNRFLSFISSLFFKTIKYNETSAPAEGVTLKRQVTIEVNSLTYLFYLVGLWKPNHPQTQN